MITWRSMEELSIDSITIDGVEKLILETLRMPSLRIQMFMSVGLIILLTHLFLLFIPPTEGIFQLISSPLLLQKPIKLE